MEGLALRNLGVLPFKIVKDKDTCQSLLTWYSFLKIDTDSNMRDTRVTSVTKTTSEYRDMIEFTFGVTILLCLQTHPQESGHGHETVKVTGRNISGANHNVWKWGRGRIEYIRIRKPEDLQISWKYKYEYDMKIICIYKHTHIYCKQEKLNILIQPSLKFFPKASGSDR